MKLTLQFKIDHHTHAYEREITTDIPAELQPALGDLVKMMKDIDAEMLGERAVLYPAPELEHLWPAGMEPHANDCGCAAENTDEPSGVRPNPFAAYPFE